MNEVLKLRVSRKTLSDSLPWKGYRKTTVTKAVLLGPLQDPHIVETKEGDCELPVGWRGVIALDSDGDPYPIVWDVFKRTYEQEPR